jgi:DNA-binding response OmpR family regulator
MPTGVNFSTKPKIVLVIEDSPTQALHTNAVLERSGIQSICATNGLMGLSLSRQIHPDLIVLDIQLPDVDGYEVCRQLKADPNTSEIPVIMLTRNDALDSLQKGIECGADDYIPKDAFADVVLVETLRQMGFLTR